MASYIYYSNIKIIFRLNLIIITKEKELGNVQLFQRRHNLNSLKQSLSNESDKRLEVWECHWLAG